MSTREPIIYDQTLDVRFGDLDPYGHLNSSIYLDIVNSSRLIYLERELGVKTSDLIERGIGFYLTRATQEFLRPVNGFARVRVRSHVANQEAARIRVAFALENPDTEKVYARGELEFVVMDLKTQRPTPVPEWMEAYFYKS